MNNILIKGSVGTGKTILARAMAYYIGSGCDIESVFVKDVINDLTNIENYIQSEYVEYIQVHPSMTYDDIVYGIDITPNGSLTMDYAEKRIMQLCDRADGRTEDFFIILDDISRTNAGALLGNILYGMEYRGQPVALSDGNYLTIPENVCIIITESSGLSGHTLEYAIRRRFDYVKELFASTDVLDNYYNNSSLSANRQIIINVFESVKNFVAEHIIKEPSIQLESYVPGHGLLMVDRNGNMVDILLRVKRKVEYQIIPYLKDMVKAGIMTAADTDIENLFTMINGQLNVGQNVVVSGTAAERILYKKGELSTVVALSLSDSYDYYVNTIIPDGCKEHRSIIECIIDAIFTNRVFEIDKVLSDILLNTNIVRVEDRNHTGVFAAIIAEKTVVKNFFYTKANGETRDFYSTNNAVKGKWKGFSPAYKIKFGNGAEKIFISLNAFREGWIKDKKGKINISSTVKLDETANIYVVLYLLVKAYLTVYKTELSLMLLTDPSYGDIYKLITLESSYWEHVNKETYTIKGNNLKFQHLAKAVVNLKTLWTVVGDYVQVDDSKFANITAGTIADYTDIYNISGTTKDIKIEGVKTMADFNDYQQIMESVGVRQMIFQGPPGTSKTYESKRFVLQQLDPASSVIANANATQEDISRALDGYKLTSEDYEEPGSSAKLTTGGWDLVQFHPSYGYEDFIRGIEVKPVNGTPTYSSVNRILGKIAEFAKLAEKKAVAGNTDVPKFYLIVDEINRANLATVFGELIYGLEYRDSNVSTPYEVNDKVTNAVSKDIVLGKNLFIIGTMNTADKSIDPIDYAIRRRFIFVDSPAKRETVVSCYQNISGANDENSIEVLLFDAVSHLLEGDTYFNNEYQRNDVRVGHTYFLRKPDGDYKEIMKNRFVFQVIPILREYMKDGILESYDELNENTAEQIVAAGDEKVKLVAENIMFYIKHFDEKSQGGERIDNGLIKKFIDDICDKFKY